jgi:hypothetical protein
MEERRVRRRRWRLLTLCTFLAITGIHIWLERSNRLDSIGLWYTLFSASIYTALFLLVVKVIVVLKARLFH